MKALVIYDSAFGNTQKVAEAISAALNDDTAACVEVRHIDAVTPAELAEQDLLIIGCPTQRMSITEGMRAFLERIPKDGLKGVKVATFDTRISNEDMQELVQSRITKMVVRTFLHRFAAGPLAAELVKKGAERVMEPAGFYVQDTEGPLKDGELTRAAAWALQIPAMADLSPRSWS